MKTQEVAGAIQEIVKANPGGIMLRVLKFEFAKRHPGVIVSYSKFDDALQGLRANGLTRYTSKGWVACIVTTQPGV